MNVEESSFRFKSQLARHHPPRSPPCCIIDPKPQSPIRQVPRSRAKSRDKRAMFSSELRASSLPAFCIETAKAEGKSFLSLSKGERGRHPARWPSASRLDARQRRTPTPGVPSKKPSVGAGSIAELRPLQTRCDRGRAASVTQPWSHAHRRPRRTRRERPADRRARLHRLSTRMEESSVI